MSISVVGEKNHRGRRHSRRRGGGHCGGRVKGRQASGCAAQGAVDRAARAVGTAVDHRVIPWMSVSMVCFSFGSSWIKAWSLETAWITVVWSLPPKARPMSLSDAWVSWRERYMATWRGKATDLVRFLARMSESLMPKNSATLRW